MLKKNIIEIAKKIKEPENFGGGIFNLNLNLNLIMLRKNIINNKNSTRRPKK
jgi:hypothetical protein